MKMTGGKKGGTGWRGAEERQQPFEHQQLHRSPPQLAASICSSYILRGIVWSRRGYTHRVRPERTKEIKNIFFGTFGGRRNELFPSYALPREQTLLPDARAPLHLTDKKIYTFRPLNPIPSFSSDRNTGTWEPWRGYRAVIIIILDTAQFRLALMAQDCINWRLDRRHERKTELLYFCSEATWRLYCGNRGLLDRCIWIPEDVGHRCGLAMKVADPRH